MEEDDKLADDTEGPSIPMRDAVHAESPIAVVDAQPAAEDCVDGRREKSVDEFNAEGRNGAVDGTENASDGNDLSNVGELKESNATAELHRYRVEANVPDVYDISSLCSLNVSRLDVYSLANYSFGRKENESKSQEARDVPAEEISSHRAERFRQRGLRRTVAAVVLVHQHRFPHVLLLQRTAGHGGYFLPGGRLRPGESMEEGIRRKLTAKLSPAGAGPECPAWEIGEECAC